MDPQEQRFGSFPVVFGLAESFGALAVILITVWLGSYHDGFSWSSNPDVEFNWHPVLMTIGMIFLYANSIMLYRAFPNHSKRNLKLSHAVLHIIALILAVIGLQAVFDSHNLHTPAPIPNLYTLHSWIGLIAVILFSCQWLSGLITFLYPGLKQPLRAFYLPVHVYFGLLAFVCSVMAALLGLLEKAHWVVLKYDELPPEGLLINFIGIILIIFGSLVVYIVTEPQFKRQPRPEDEILLTGNLE